ncbi:MAG: hypothetical protein H0T62_12220 [Parachlamydiaceae bacterium]|nr:hypothetical protein [Parachlamydiaceae bacterium]
MNSVSNIDQAKITWIAKLSKLSEFEGCGICEKNDAELYEEGVFWFNPLGKSVHANCFKKIEKIENSYLEQISSLFFDKQQFGRMAQNEAGFKAVRAVMIACYPESISTYLEKNGEQELKALFNTVGIEAAKKYADKY